MKFRVEQRKNGTLDIFVICCDGLEKFLATSRESNKKFTSGVYKGANKLVTANMLSGLFLFDNLVFSRLQEDFSEFNLKPLLIPIISATALKNNKIKLTGHETFEELSLLADKIGSDNIDFYFAFSNEKDAQIAMETLENLVCAIIYAVTAE